MIVPTITALAAISVPSGMGRWFAATASGLLRSEDRGAIWTPAETSLAFHSALTVSPDQAVVLAASTDGIWRSTDLGDTWRLRPLVQPAPIMTAIACSPDFAVDGTVLVATLEDGIFRSGDHGQTWHHASAGLLDYNVNAITFLDHTRSLAGTSSGLTRSDNAGRHWDQTDATVDPSGVVAFAGNGMNLFGIDESDRLWRLWDGRKKAIPVLNDMVIGVHLLPGVSDDRLLIVCEDQIRIGSLSGDEWTAIHRMADGRSAVASALVCVGDRSELLIADETGTVYGVGHGNVGLWAR